MRFCPDHTPELEECDGYFSHHICDDHCMQITTFSIDDVTSTTAAERHDMLRQEGLGITFRASLYRLAVDATRVDSPIERLAARIMKFKRVLKWAMPTISVYSVGENSWRADFGHVHVFGDSVLAVYQEIHDELEKEIRAKIESTQSYSEEWVAVYKEALE